MGKLLKIQIPFLVFTLLFSSCQLIQKNRQDNSSQQADGSHPNDTVATHPDETLKTNKDKKLENKTDVKLTEAELQKYAYEVGLDPKDELSDEDLQTIAKRKNLRQLEKALDSQKERLHYSKVLPWLQNDDEKITYLTIPSIEGRQAWVNKNKIWQRTKETKDFQELVENMDIAAGMPASIVRKSWGEPENVEYSGNPIYKNERWKYTKQVSTPNGYRQEKRYVYFEGGRVVGWETE